VSDTPAVTNLLDPEPADLVRKMRRITTSLPILEQGHALVIAEGECEDGMQGLLEEPTDRLDVLGALYLLRIGGDDLRELVASLPAVEKIGDDGTRNRAVRLTWDELRPWATRLSDRDE